MAGEHEVRPYINYPGCVVAANLVFARDTANPPQSPFTKGGGSSPPLPKRLC